ncbi:MAG TPA: aminotransferase class I/II-fold pyridoxal phosphate-dependent enzyme [Phycisphaerae bacterium]|nr:aminotransferase class I/II-fold pyridoxal phosphate-dependent enzyme [Phycisphaerae bacterium]
MDADKPVSLNLNVRGMGQSATLAIKDKCRELRRRGRMIYDFGLGQSPFPVPTSIVEALRLAAPEKDYQPVKGLPALREAVAEYHRRKDQIDAHPDGVIVGPGSKELMFILQIVYYGEILLVPPCWVSYWPQARIVGRRISLIHTTHDAGWKLSAERLHESLEIVGDDHRPRLLVLNYPSNPTGQTFTMDELREIAEVCRKFNLIVLSDEIYGQLHFHGEHASIGRYYPEGTIVSSGLSKWCGAGGWRLGTFTFPRELDWLITAMAAVASETYTSVSAPIQHAAITAFHCGVEIERYLWHARRVLDEIARRSVAILQESGIRVLAPAGGFYLWLDFSARSAELAARGIKTGVALCDHILQETGVAILPGAAFGRSRSELTARLAFVDFDGAKALAASETTPLDQGLPGGMIEQHAEHLLEGMHRLAAWARQEAVVATTHAAS